MFHFRGSARHGRSREEFASALIHPRRIYMYMCSITRVGRQSGFCIAHSAAEFIYLRRFRFISCRNFVKGYFYTCKEKSCILFFFFKLTKTVRQR